MRDSVALRASTWDQGLSLEFKDLGELNRLIGYECVLEGNILLFCRAVSPTRGQHRGSHTKTSNGPTSTEWPYRILFVANLRGTPRFSPVETEGCHEGDHFIIDLPPLDKLPWPKPWGEREAEHWMRTAAERLLWGKAQGSIRTQMQAAEYLRKQMPVKGYRMLTPEAWKTMLASLDLPVRADVIQTPA